MTQERQRRGGKGEGMDEFDYVIVGAGSAGCVLANRLSADPAVSVCVVEAGPPDRSPLIHVPLGMLPLMTHKLLNWCYSTLPQAGTAGRPIYSPRGKTLGGTSAINGMVYMRGHRGDYDEWAAAGNPGWSYREVLPYFLRSEHNEQFGLPYHGKDGPLNVTDVESYSPLMDMMFESARRMGWPVIDDFNGASQEGFSRRQATMKNGRRHSTATAFLHPVRQRPNLEVRNGIVVDRVRFEGRRAAGIDIIDTARANARSQIRARREVILAGGAYASPAILQRSGIGDTAELSRLGIAPVHDLPGVGRNLQDHLITQVSHVTQSTVPYGLTLAKLPWLAWQGVKYLVSRRGVFANNILHAGGFIRSRPDLDRPDLQLILLPANRTLENPNAKGHGYGIIVLLMRPQSHGRVSLASADPLVPPQIDPQFLSVPADVDLVVHGMKLARRLLADPAWDGVRGLEILPGPAVNDDAALADYARKRCATAFHPVGTCRMGQGDDAVVDAELRVRGVEGLRVADASIMPRIIGGNTNAPAIMIGEKASDLVLGRPPLAPAIV